MINFHTVQVCMKIFTCTNVQLYTCTSRIIVMYTIHVSFYTECLLMQVQVFNCSNWYAWIFKCSGQASLSSSEMAVLFMHVASECNLQSISTWIKRVWPCETISEWPFQQNTSLLKKSAFEDYRVFEKCPKNHVDSYRVSGIRL